MREKSPYSAPHLARLDESRLQLHSYRVQRSVQISLPNIRCAVSEKLFACSLFGGAKSSHAQKWLSLGEETPNPEYPEGLAYEVEIDSPWHAQRSSDNQFRTCAFLTNAASLRIRGCHF